MDNGHPTIPRTYITCPDCGRTGPDAGGRCQDCHDNARLRAAVAEWARAAHALDIDKTIDRAGEHVAAMVALFDLSRELGLVDA